ncbi:MAG: DUF885 family protein [Alphaproteobacteria bacterium]|nr:DUF885 family protein [Alphaproteobacteria bacterium]
MLASDGERNTVPDHLPHVDAATQAMRLAYWQKVMRKLDAIAYNQLSAKQQINYDVYKPQIQVLINNERFRDYEMPLKAGSNFWSRLTTYRHPFQTVQDYRHWIAQMRDIPRYFREETQNMRAGQARGFDQPKVTMIGRDASLEITATAKPQETGLYTPFRNMPSTISAAEQSRLRAAAALVIRSIAQPAFAKLYHYLHYVYIPHCRTSIAAYDLPDGKAYYQAKIFQYTTTHMTPQQIHELGLAQTAKLHQQMLDIIHRIGFKGSFAEFQNYLRTNPKFYPKTKLGYLKDAAWIAKEVDGKLSQFFGRLPRMRFTIKPVPAAIAPFATSSGGPGLFLINTYDLSERPLYNLIPLTLHESAPGHAFQMALAMEDRSLPDFRRYTYISAYGEGWALYCEWLGKEMGMYKTPYDQLGMLGWQIWRSARLVVDTGIHTEGWTRTQAVDYLRRYTLLPDHQIQTEVDRYITWPGQALSYYIGEMAIREDRARAEKALGAKFNIRAFDDAVLALGSVPLPVLNRHMDAFIRHGGIGPFPDEE